MRCCASANFNSKLTIRNTRYFSDQLGREVEISFPPSRIISVVPSQTELLADLGLDDEVIGITRFCVHPQKWFRAKTRVGGTKQLHRDQIASLNPDLIIANREENAKEQIDELAKLFPVWISDVKTLNDAYVMMHAVGEITGKQEAALARTEKIKNAFREWRTDSKGIKPKNLNSKLTCAYLIWNDPLMTIGGDTFIHHMLGKAGFENVFGNLQRYPQISRDLLQEKNPDFLFLSSEPFPFRWQHADDMKKWFPHAEMLLVDGEMFSWYGSRMLKAPEYFRQLHQSIAALK